MAWSVSFSLAISLQILHPSCSKDNDLFSPALEVVKCEDAWKIELPIGLRMIFVLTMRGFGLALVGCIDSFWKSLMRSSSCIRDLVFWAREIPNFLMTTGFCVSLDLMSGSPIDLARDRSIMSGNIRVLS